MKPDPQAPDRSDLDPHQRRIRELAIDALKRGRIEETEEILRSENLTVVQLTQELLIYQAELEMQAEELWEANQRLGRAQEKFRRFFQFLPQPALTIDPSTASILDANDLARTIFRIEGPSRGALSQFRRLGRGRAAQDLLASAVSEAFGRGRARLSEVSLATRSGQVIRCRIDLERVADDPRAAPILLAVISDETESRARIDQLAREGRLAAAISDLLSLASNPAFSLEDVLARAPDVMTRGLSAAGDASVRILYSGREYTSRDWRAQRVDCLVAIEINGLTAGQVEFGVGTIEAASDPLALLTPSLPQSEDRQAEDIYRAFAELLARIIENRRLSQELTRTERLAAIGQIAGGVAHDFNNLLTVIVGEAEELADTEAIAPQYRELASGILSAALKAAHLTHYLLAYARRQPLEPRKIAPALLLADILPTLHRALREEVELKVEVAPDLWDIEVDPGQIKDTILNLMLNAQEAMPAGGTITVALRNEGAPPQTRRDVGMALSAFLLLEVRDTGQGMTPDVLAKALEPFFTTKERGMGSGLGLSMVSGFVQQSGGFLDIQSVPGTGTRVRLRFPVRREAEV
ncbi:MAG: ATP-binding protein [Hyphomonas sp.]